MHNIRVLAVAVILLPVVNVLSAAQSSSRLKMIPGEFEMRNPPVSWSIAEGDRLTINAAKNTNWFISPLDLKSWDSAPMLLFRPAEDFVFSAKMSLQPRARWDGGALVLFVNETTWAKLCLEAPDGPAGLSVIMVVTRGESDDSYSIQVPGNSMYMKIAKIGPTLVFYVSADGRSWQMVRAFRLGSTKDLRAGFLAQSPVGEGSTVSFSDIRYAATRVADIFKGE
jgi:regulation of enolase protein 1 (concanavalin A-like superfamily)